MVNRLAYFLLAGAVLAAGCSEEPQALQAEPAANEIAAATPEGAHPAIRSLMDQGNPNKKLVADPNGGVRRVVVDVRCPADRIVPCGAEATRAVAIWLAEHGPEWGEYQGEPVTNLLVNVDPDGAFGGYQIIGAMPTATALRTAGMAEILTMFRWNGAGENGEIAVAKWCGGSRARQTATFCSAFFEDECSNEKAPEVVKACPAAILNRTP